MLAPMLSHTRSSRLFAWAAEKPNDLKAATRSWNLSEPLTEKSTAMDSELLTRKSTAMDSEGDDSST